MTKTSATKATKPAIEESFSPPLDAGIEPYVMLLRKHGIETFESCQGGEGHCFKEPTVRFHGHDSEGFRALAVAIEHHLPVRHLRRYWTVIGREPVGPSWEMTFDRFSAS